MSPRTKEQLEALKENRRSAILDAALKVFSAHGYNDATISMIATEAQMSKGLMYTYFKSKEELLEELLMFGLNRMSEYLGFVPEHGIATKKEFEQVLRGIIGLYTQQQDFWRLYLVVILQKNITPKFEKIMHGFIEEYLAIFVGYFHKKKVLNPTGEALLFGAMLDGLMFDMIVAPGTFPVEETIALIVKKFA